MLLADEVPDFSEVAPLPYALRIRPAVGAVSGRSLVTRREVVSLGCRTVSNIAGALAVTSASPVAMDSTGAV